MRHTSPEGLEWSIAWDSPTPRGTAADATRGSLSLRLRGAEQWQGNRHGHGFSWTWIELLEFLSSAWPYLILEEGFPLGLSPDDPAQVLAAAKNRWKDLPVGICEREGALLESFEHVHDLSKAIQGAVLPSLWVVREGRRCWLAGRGRLVDRPTDDVTDSLEALGDTIASRIASLEDQRARAALGAWNDKSSISLVDQIQIASGLSAEKRKLIEKREQPGRVWGLGSDRLANNELLAAARMSSSFDARSIARILNKIRTVSLVKAPRLDRSSDIADAVLAESLGSKPYEQGYRLAEWLRSEPGVCTQVGHVDPRGLLKDWGVSVTEVNLGSSEIDAFGCWGQAHGPAVFLNLDGLHTVTERGQRATLAHEICHLLVDRRGALPLAEVLGGVGSPLVEARARAFAAELLLPRFVAGSTMAAANKDPAGSARTLCNRYEVSTEILAWQACNSGVQMPNNVRNYLQKQVSEPWRF